jgi:hypothetical protein
MLNRATPNGKRRKGWSNQDVIYRIQDGLMISETPTDSDLEILERIRRV